MAVRVSAKELTALILDEERLRAERKDRKSWKSRVTGIDDYDPDIGPSAPKTPKKTERRNKVTDDDDLEMRLAIEASKNEAEEDARRRANKGPQSAPDDDDLAKAIKLSKEEEELRRRELEEANANSLFDDTPSQPAAAQPTGWNQGYQQQPTVDWFGNVIDAQAPQQTGYLQQGGYSNGFGGMNPQMTGYMAQPLQQQNTAFHMNNPYAQQNGFGGFGQPQQPMQQQHQPEPTPAPGSNNPWASNNNNHLAAADTQIPMQTGSNNPFASKMGQPAQNHAQMKPTLSSLQEQKASTAFNPIMNYQAPVQQPVQEPATRLSPQPQSFQPQQQSNQPVNPMHARLNELLATGDGLDTYGNVGDLRIPSQHTAPGTFVNSAGAGLNRLTANATGNPFLNSQFTGMPQQRIAPAQTGPVPGYGGGYGAQTTNPFGGAGANRQQGGQPGGNLIDL
jgi:epsin